MAGHGGNHGQHPHDVTPGCLQGVAAMASCLTSPFAARLNEGGLHYLYAGARANVHPSSVAKAG